MTTPISKCECPNRVLCPRGCCCARCGLAIEPTPTTDSKNSSEKCCDYCWSKLTESCHAKGCVYCHTQNTADTGWGKRFKEEFYDIGTAGYLIGTESISLENGEKIISFIQHIAKEEYERGRKDAVEFIRAKIGPDMQGDFDYQHLKQLLEAALETQPWVQPAGAKD